MASSVLLNTQSSGSFVSDAFWDLNVSWLCAKAPVQVCRLVYDEELPKDCLAPIPFLDMISRPILLVLCGLGFIVAAQLSISVYGGNHNSARGKFEYACVFFLFGLLNIVTILDTCFFTKNDTSGRIWVFVDVAIGVCMALGIILAGLSEFGFIREFARMLIFIITLCTASAVLVIFMVLKLYLAIEIMWAASIAASLVLYSTLQIIRICTRFAVKSLLILLLTLGCTIFGFVAWIGFGNWICSNITKFISGVEVFWLCIVVSLWLFYWLFAQSKKDEIKDQTIAVVDINGKKVPVLSSNPNA
ncbi:hypothetical protein Pelo_11794 [Pelomyxa schiedti]|nr:hypothetical protein Pelo_11794 [Pelomyxa schiedti]